tara:strand:- start:206 stop:514 length:309 start_codon:yes stop_codon:yes gene_type:complete
MITLDDRCNIFQAITVMAYNLGGLLTRNSDLSDKKTEMLIQSNTEVLAVVATLLKLSDDDVGNVLSKITNIAEEARTKKDLSNKTINDILSEPYQPGESTQA